MHSQEFTPYRRRKKMSLWTVFQMHYITATIPVSEVRLDDYTAATHIDMMLSLLEHTIYTGWQRSTAECKPEFLDYGTTLMRYQWRKVCVQRQ